ncbi:hypothetical protein GGQ97_002321 [Sphingomonas kaistensis]|uniref:Uncharacterized protein n=1 Tax=Sphingomonas kaistensis TaxID=298708 RepID=A0A7X5Y826_9SPHN|nr:hypothetical protein [Sphingomonas kaistensis]NJC06528.1 hypothetical protein [Sphingomonas kaistensis]
MRDALEACELAAKRSIGDETPLDFMLAVMRDDSQDMRLRTAMAQAAAPYVHAKPSDAGPKGKKEEAAAASKTAGMGTDWGDDLGAPSSAIN